MTGPSLLYVAITRARTGLHLLHRSRPPRMLANNPREAEAEPSTPASAGAKVEKAETRETGVDPEGRSGEGARESPLVAAEPDEPETRAFSDEEPTAPSSLSGTWFVSGDTGTFMVEVADEAVTVCRVPDGTTAMQALATGYVLQSSQEVKWMLRTNAGQVVSTTTSSTVTSALETVIGKVEQAEKRG